MLKTALYTKDTFERALGSTVLEHRCVGCEAIFGLSKNLIQRGRKGLYCSTRCKIQSRTTRIHTNCSNCGIDIVKLTTKTSSGIWFCSRSCSTSYNNRKRQIGPSKKKCCRKHCDNCVEIWTDNLCKKHKEERTTRLATGNPITVGELRNKKSVLNQHRSSRHNLLGHRARYHLKHLLSVSCFRCGYSPHVELCHIKPLRDFPDGALVSEVNNECNVVPLCPNCHWEMDHNSELLKLIGARWRDRTSGLPSNSLTSQV